MDEFSNQVVQEPQESTVLNPKTSRWQNLETGEIIDAVEITKTVSRHGFMITYLSAIINLIEVLGNKKMQIVKYILENMEKSNNTLVITTRELGQKAKVGHNTVIDTLKILEDAGIIKRRIGSLMVNSRLIHRGNQRKEQALIARFQEFDGK